MTKQCNCHTMLGIIETLLDKLSAMPRDTDRLGTPAVVAVENLLNRQHARIRAQHERCISNAKPIHING